jgi:hypothetical protein
MSMSKFAGFPLSAWAFALRTWVAMMLALYVTFWLQLENAWLAAVTVGILSLQTRGQAYQKAVYRLLMTVVGVVVSIIIAGLFAQVRDLFVIAYASWLGVCVYVGGLLDGNRAFGAVLAGFTVAFVAVTQIDSPQNIFMTGVDRGAVIAVAIAALALVNDVFLAPNLHTILSTKLAGVHQRVRTFAFAILRGKSADPTQSANLLREITALHPEVSALVIESSVGGARGAAARTASVALVAEVSAALALASLPAATLPSLRSSLARALANPTGEDSCALRLHMQQHMQAGDADAHDALFECHSISTLPRFQPPPRRTQRTVFPYYALLSASPQSLWDLSCWGSFPRRPVGLSRPRPPHARPAVTRSHRRPGGRPTPCVSSPNTYLPLTPGSGAQRPACLSDGPDFRHPDFPRRLAVCVTGLRPSGDLCGVERYRA